MWTGSHNWSPWALKLDDVILRSSKRGVVDAYTRHFVYMFDHAWPWPTTRWTGC